MTRKQRKQKEQKPKKQSHKVEPKTYDTPMAHKDAINHRAITIMSGVAIVGSLAFMLFFFTTDMKDKILASNTSPPAQAQVITEDEPEEKGSSFYLTIMSRGDLSQEDVVAYLESMDDETFEQFIGALIDSVDADDLNSEDSAYIIDMGDLDALDPSEAVANKDKIIEYLTNLDDKEFGALVQAVADATDAEGVARITDRVTDRQETTDSSDEEATEDDVLRPSLEEAYEEAERLYPNQIDGSKRLKLIEDLNATDYLYYVAEDGDTLLALSKSFDVPLGQLVELNGIHDADEIPAGMIILFPSDTEQPDITN